MVKRQVLDNANKELLEAILIAQFRVGCLENVVACIQRVLPAQQNVWKVNLLRQDRRDTEGERAQRSIGALGHLLLLRQRRYCITQ